MRSVSDFETANGGKVGMTAPCMLTRLPRSDGHGNGISVGRVQALHPSLGFGVWSLGFGVWGLALHPHVLLHRCTEPCA